MYNWLLITTKQVAVQRWFGAKRTTARVKELHEIRRQG